MASKILKTNLDKQTKDQKIKLNVDTDISLYLILKIDPSKRIPAISASINNNPLINYDDGFYSG